MAIYLAGPINGCTDDQAMGWRMVAARLLGGAVIDPMRRDYRGIEAENVEAIVHADIEDIRQSTGVLVWAKNPSWGTAMEIVYARQIGKRVVAVVDEHPVSPWVAFHCELTGSLEQAVKVLLS